MAKVSPRGRTKKGSSTSTEIVTQIAGSVPAVPDFMQSKSTGLEEMKQFIRPPRLKVVQKSSDDRYLDVFNPGDVIIVPQMMLLSPMGDDKEGAPFHIVPIFTFAEWCTWTPLALRGQVPGVIYRTQDVNDPIVVKAQNPKTRFETINYDGQDIECRHVEHINFLFVLVGEHELAGTPMAMSFSRGEHGSGASALSLLSLRQAPIYGCNIECTCRYRKNDKGTWYGLDLSNPSEDSGVEPFVQDKANFESLEKAHTEMKKAHANAIIDIEHDDPDAEEPTTDEF